jgi:succinate dehydrogenase/fumarate reductase cytochrome b subunit
VTAKTQRPAARALFSSIGVVVLGAYLWLELWLHAAALGGPLAYRGRLERLLEAPGIAVLGVFIVAALALHGCHGIVLALRPELNVRLGRPRGWMFVLERLSAFAFVAFLALHVAFFWWPLTSGALSPSDAYGSWVVRLSATYAEVPVAALGYAFGLAVFAFHFAHGAFMETLRWGFLTTRQSRRRTGPAFAGLGLGVFVAGFLPVIHLATGDRHLFERAPLEAEGCAPSEVG